MTCLEGDPLFGQKLAVVAPGTVGIARKQLLAREKQGHCFAGIHAL
jgi:hypothetical protein